MTDKINAFKAYMNGKKVAVIGIGISNTPLISYLVSCGACVTAHDKKQEAELGDTAKTLKEMGVTLVLGETYLDEIKGDIVFKTPGMRYDTPALVTAKENGAIITSEMEVFFELCSAPILAVTGSDGKTTTTTLIYKMLEASGKTVHLGGNIGKPILARVEEIKEEDYVVLELSSFQLHTMKKSPKIAVMTNITPNHLDMHKDYQEYIDAKKNIMLYQGADDILVANLENKVTAEILNEAKGETRGFSKTENGVVTLKDDAIFVGDTEILKTSDIKLPGVHNVENYMAAIGAVYGIASVDAIQTIAKTFGGVEHRIEFVRELSGVKYYNSSIDSSPNRTINTLNVFKKNVILIAGGKDKGISYEEIGAPIVDACSALILIGATSHVIFESVNKVLRERKQALPVYFEKTYEDAVWRAKNQAKKGDVVLLSSASTSFDMFKNFEERGNLFKELVKNL